MIAGCLRAAEDYRHARRWLSKLFSVFVLLSLANKSFLAQTSTLPGPMPQQLEIDQIAEILGLTENFRRTPNLQAETGCDPATALGQLGLRQHILESVQAADLDVDSAAGEIANERAELGNLQTSLKSRRDKTVAKLNAAALITGSGVSAGVSASQFTSVGTRTNNIGDGVGIGSGAASTLLAYLAVRKQHGPDGTVAEVPNMLAPLFDRVPVLNAGYPPVVMRYLRSVPPAEPEQSGTRLEQLKAEWVKAGRLNAIDTASGQKKITVLTTSGLKDVRISIDDLTDRIAMLGDVSGRISLMKRDLSLLLRSYMAMPLCPVR